MLRMEAPLLLTQALLHSFNGAPHVERDPEQHTPTSESQAETVFRACDRLAVDLQNHVGGLRRCFARSARLNRPSNAGAQAMRNGMNPFGPRIKKTSWMV